jgi:hypothetical protein
MIWVEAMVDVPCCSALAAPDPPMAWITSAIMSKLEKIIMYHAGRNGEFSLPTRTALGSTKESETTYRLPIVRYKAAEKNAGEMTRHTTCMRK